MRLTLHIFVQLRDEAGENISMKTFLQRIRGFRDWEMEYFRISCWNRGCIQNRKSEGFKIPIGRGVYGAVTGILQKMIAAGGRDTEKDLYGESGGYCTRLSKKTAGKPCPYSWNCHRRQLIWEGLFISVLSARKMR